MTRGCLPLALAALVAAALPSPGSYLALGLGIAAVGTGWVGFARRTAPGATRLAAAASITLGAMAIALGTVRVVIALVAIARIDRMLG
jgi:hypothetical protein